MNPCEIEHVSEVAVMAKQVEAAWIARCPLRSFEFHHYRVDGSCQCVPRDAVNRNLRAEQRAAEEGHRAFVQDDGSVRVVSDTYPGKWYRVTYVGTDTGIRFECVPQGEAAFRDDHLDAYAEPGVVPCKHAAVAARRLEREGLAQLTEAGVWRTTAKAEALRPPAAQPEDPFEGLPS